MSQKDLISPKIRVKSRPFWKLNALLDLTAVNGWVYWLAMKRSVIQFGISGIGLVLIALVFFGGCGSGDSDKKQAKLSHIYEKQGPYQGWEKKRFQNVVFVVSPEIAEDTALATYSKVFDAMKRNSSTFLGVLPPDSLTIYFYGDAKHGITVTGFLATYFDGQVIHFWQPSSFGQPVAKQLLTIWSEKEPKFKFLKHGIIALLDGAGNNYHQKTLSFVDSGQFMHLAALAQNESIDADRERYQSAMAASFVDYIAYEYGAIYLKHLYESDGSFTEAVRVNFGISVDSLENNWLEVIEEVVRK